MKKLILAIIACAFIASPVIATDFAAEKAKVLGDIITKTEQAKNDPAQLDFLKAQRSCVEKSTNIEGLQECAANFKPTEKKTAVKK